jgi:hypothetical protein
MPPASYTFWDFLPFWIVNYGLAIVIWSCIGRFLLYFLIAARQPNNYIFRFFVLLTEWIVRPVGYITPRAISPVFHAPIAAFWLFVLRIGAFVLMLQVGLVPSFAKPG